MTSIQFAKTRPNGQGQGEVLRQRCGGEVGADHRGDEDCADIFTCQGAGDRCRLLQTQPGQAGARHRGAEKTTDVIGGLTVANENEAHVSTLGTAAGN